jgi:hypothetical protein
MVEPVESAPRTDSPHGHVQQPRRLRRQRHVRGDIADAPPRAQGRAVPLVAGEGVEQVGEAQPFPFDRLPALLSVHTDLPYRWLENRVIDALGKAGYGDITSAQMKILQRVGPGGTRLTDLAEQAQVTKQTAGFLVDQLEKAG